jgi:hypothetical protein
MLRLAIAVERPQRLSSLLKNSIRCWFLGGAAVHRCDKRPPFLVLALAAAGDRGAHEEFFSKLQSRSQGIQ